MSTAPSPRPAPKRRNLRGPERAAQILEGAVALFAEQGFEAQTRELARRLGITHAVLYRHFASKEALIEAVYAHVFESRWQPEWDALLRDRRQPLAQRLDAFYRAYAGVICDPIWVRIFFFAGLRRTGHTARYMTLIRTRLIDVLVAERRAALSLPDSPDAEAEREAFWALHAAVFYIGVRRHIYEAEAPQDLEKAVAERVAAVLQPLGLQSEARIPASPASNVSTVSEMITERSSGSRSS